MRLPASLKDPSDATVAVALCAFALALLLPGMGSLSGIRHPDEAYYLSVILEMERTGDWVIPRIDGAASFFKPPLLYWGSLLCRALLGGSLLVTRLPAALFAAGTVGLTYLLARQWRDRRTALLAALALTAMVGVQRFGRSAMLEAPLMFGATLAVYGAALARRSPRAWGLALTGLGAALSVLVKWHGVALVPLAAALATLAATRNLRALFSLGSLVGALCAVLLPLPWFLLAAREPSFAGGFVAENIARLSEAREAPISLLGVPVYGLPFSPLALAALLSLRRPALQDPAVLVPLGWLAVVLAFWLLPASAQYTHHAQAGLPAAALLAALALAERSLAGRVAQRLVAAALALAGPLVAGAALLLSGGDAAAALAAGTALLAAGVLLWRPPVASSELDGRSGGDARPSTSLGVTGGALGVTGGALGVTGGTLGVTGGTLGVTGAAPGATGATLEVNGGVAATAVAMALTLGWALPRADAEFLPPQAAAALAQGPLDSYGMYPGYFRFALGNRPIGRLWEEGEISGSLAAGHTVILDAAEAALPPDVPLVEVARWERTSPRIGLAQLREALSTRSMAPLRVPMRAVRRALEGERQ